MGEEKMDEAIKILRDGRDAERLRRAELIAKRVKDLNVEDYVEGVTVKFSKSFGGSADYTYVALKVVNAAKVEVWYITGQAGSRTNEEFEEFLADAGGFDSFVTIL